MIFLKLKKKKASSHVHSAGDEASYFKIIFLWFLLLRFFFRILSLSLYGLTSTPHTLSLSLSLFLFSPRKFVIRIGDSQCTVGSSDLCLLISFEIKGESALNLFRSLSIFFFFLWISEFATFCLVFFVSDSLIHRQFKNAVRFSVWFSRKRRKTKKKKKRNILIIVCIIYMCLTNLSD